MTIPILVTLEQARAQLKRPAPLDGSPSATDADLQMKIDAATEMVCMAINERATPDAEWTAEIENWTGADLGSPSTLVPAVVVQAILVMVAHLDRYRGDDADDKGLSEDGAFPPGVKALLRNYLDPALA